MTCKNGLQAAVPKRERGQGFDPPYPLAAAASVEVEVVIQAAPTTAARVVWASIRVMPGLPTIAAAQVGAAGGTTPCFRAVSVCMKP